MRRGAVVGRPRTQEVADSEKTVYKYHATV